MSKRSKIFGLLLMLTFLGLIAESCTKKEDIEINNINHNTILILGHMGMGSHFQYPGNTYESIKPALEIGTDGCELDVRITRDSVLVLFHNPKLEGRTTCGGKVYEQSWNDISSCVYSGIHSNINILRLDSLFSRIKNLNDFYFSLDCKLYEDLAYDIHYRKIFLSSIKKLCDKYSMGNNVFIEGDLGFLMLAKEIGLNSKAVLIGGNIDQAAENDLFGIGFDTNISRDSIEYAHSKGIYVIMWGANTDLGNKKALSLNPDILQTDKPIPLLMLLDRMNYEASVP